MWSSIESEWKSITKCALIKILAKGFLDAITSQLALLLLCGAWGYRIHKIYTHLLQVEDVKFELSCTFEWKFGSAYSFKVRLMTWDICEV